MYKKTSKKFLYYKYNNLYFKVPTYGIIFKIIDFGRSIFTFKNKIFCNDIFSEFGDCESQYDHPIKNVDLFVNNNKIKYNCEPNYSFDMCRLTTTILEEIKNHDIFKEKDDITNNFLDLLNVIITDKNNNKIYNEEIKDSFDLYINISRKACNGIPRNLINNKVFKIFRINKKSFPKSNYYKI